MALATWEVKVGDSLAVIRGWVERHPMTTMKQVDPGVINIYIEDDPELEDELVEWCEDYDFPCRLV